MPYIHENSQWPHFTWSMERLAEPLSSIRYRQGLLIGRMEALGFQSRQETTLEALVQEVRKSSEIEGESLDEAQVRSSIARRLGMDIAGLPQADRHIEGVVSMVLDATQRYNEPLTEERIFGWHAALFPTGWSNLTKITVGAWRDDSHGPMQVVSGPIGKEQVHYQAPDADRIRPEMDAFLNWFANETSLNLVLKAGLAHLWFVTVHPLDDGNGRVGRAIMDMVLAQSDQKDWRCYSMSAQIRNERKTYYDILESTQKGSLDITPFLTWFLECLNRAMLTAEEVLSRSLVLARFWQAHQSTQLNPRQRKVLGMLLEGLNGKLTNAKWAKITDTSPDSALRDLNDLLGKQILRREGEGRGAQYFLIQL